MKKFIRNHKKYLFLVLIGGGVAGFFPLRNYAAHRAEALVVEAQNSSDLRHAATDYQIASFLKPGDHDIVRSLADTYIKLGLPEEAVETLKRLPIEESGLQIAQIQRNSGELETSLKTLDELLKKRATATALTEKSRVLLELGRVEESVKAAEDALAYNLSDKASTRQLMLCQAVSGAKNPDPSVATATSLARELYADGMLRASRDVLKKEPSLPFEGLVLLGQTQIALKDFNEAKKPLESAVIAKPADVQAHELLKTVYEAIGDKEDATKEGLQIEQLKQGSV